MNVAAVYIGSVLVAAYATEADARTAVYRFETKTPISGDHEAFRLWSEIKGWAKTTEFSIAHLPLSEWQRQFCN